MTVSSIQSTHSAVHRHTPKLYVLPVRTLRPDTSTGFFLSHPFFLGGGGEEGSDLDPQVESVDVRVLSGAVTEILFFL